VNVLFVCTENAGRSQLAEHMFNAAAGGQHHARSAGTRPREAVYPDVIKALRARGIEPTGPRPKPLTPELLGWADRVVTMGCGDECPVTGKPTEDWALPDVRGASAADVEKIAAEIGRRMTRLLEDLDVPA
jgi:arsenate reductase